MKDFKAFAQKLISTGDYNGTILYNEKMSKHTTFKIGGEVPLFFEPEDTDSLVFLLSLLKKENIRFFILGGGSNIVFTDSVFDGVVVSLLKINKITVIENTEIKDDDVLIQTDAGSSIASFVNFCAENGFSGAEEFAGLPGTVGGALFMNARCFEKSISDLFVEAYYINLLDYTEQQKTFKNSEWAYKVSPFQKEPSLILSAVFLLKKNQKTSAEIKELNKKYIQSRKQKGHFSFPSAGSVFKNNRDFGFPSGKIIDDCSLRGKQIGNAQIAPFHANFIINLGGATQKDVKALVDFTVNVVKEKTGFCLEPEIIFVD